MHTQYHKKGLCLYFKKTIFSLVKSTCNKATKAGYLSTCTGLTEELVSKNDEKMMATAKGHFNQTEKNQEYQIKDYLPTWYYRIPRYKDNDGYKLPNKPDIYAQVQSIQESL